MTRSQAVRSFPYEKRVRQRGVVRRKWRTLIVRRTPGDGFRTGWRECRRQRAAADGPSLNLC